MPLFAFKLGVLFSHFSEICYFCLANYKFIIALARAIPLHPDICRSLNNRLLLMLTSLSLLLLLGGCASAPKQRIDALNGKSYAFHYRNLDSAKHYAEQALALSRHDDEGRAEALNNLAL